MIIRKISIENYLCYFGLKEFELVNGLNIILGENGEGKTKFFEAIDWLFNGDNKSLELLVSAKALDETELNESFKVKVAITVEQYSEKKIIAKSFVVKKIGENECISSNYMIEGIEENKLGERAKVDGKSLLDRIFPFQIRKYSMFKGESELDIFNSEDALINLISLFSEAKYYDKYSEKGSFLKEKAEKAVVDSAKNFTKNKVLYDRLESEISNLRDRKHSIKVRLNIVDEEIRKIGERLQSAETHVNNAEALTTMNGKIKNLENSISDYNAKINENYTTALFDENWIAVNFETIQKEFSAKVKRLSEDKRKLESIFNKQKGVKEGENKAKAELLNNIIPLPIGVPSKAHMEEMLSDEICKVCNRPAKKDSEAYNFMYERLNEYLMSQSPFEEEVEEEILFKFDYVNRLTILSANHEDNLKNLRLIKNKIREWFEFNDEMKRRIENLKNKLEQEKLEREKLLGNSNLSEEKITDVLKNYNSWQVDLTDKNRDRIDWESSLGKIEIELDKKVKEKGDIDIKSANSFLIKTRDLLEDIETIFNDTKENKFDEFIEKLQIKSNTIFYRINVEAFTGTIVFSKKNNSGKTYVRIELREGGKIFYRPNQSLLTSMHISILFAISELASEINTERYPMIFDAPTSSFGENKTKEFLNLIFETKGQKILLIKDFLIYDNVNKEIRIKTEFESVNRNKAFLIKLKRPFDKNNLKTLNTEIVNF